MGGKWREKVKKEKKNKTTNMRKVIYLAIGF